MSPATPRRAAGPGITRRSLIARTATVGALAAIDPLGAPAALGRSRAGRPARSHRVFGAELEYYRSDPQHLAARLDACLAAGYRTIQTYVPWNVHENTRGQLDFAGLTHPAFVHDHLDEYQIETPDREAAAGGLPARVIANTDLLGFIGACRRRGLDLILRPGPFISDEWRNGGLPDWLLNAYPDMFQRGPHGSALEPGAPFSPPVETVPGGGPLFYFAGPSYAAPEYRAEAFRWLRSFAAAIRPHLATRGGPVSALQVDDEICFYYRFGPFEVDYHPAMLARFGKTPPTDWPAPGGPVEALRPALDWQRFKAGQLAGWLSDTRAALRAGGADVPVFHEHELQLCPPANLAALARGLDVLHPEFYLDPGAWSQPTIELCAAAVRAAQRQGKAVISDEMSAGDVFIRHLLLGEGITGFLGFGYTEGIPDDAVAEMSVLGRTLRLAGGRVTDSERGADTAIVWPPEHLYAPYGAGAYGFHHDIRNVIERDIPALATLLIRAGLAFDLLDTDVARAADLSRYPSVWLATGDVLARSMQRALVGYVRRGGRLICWPEPPRLDEDLRPCTILRDALLTERTGRRYGDDAQSIEILGEPVKVWRGVQTYHLSRAAAAVAHRAGEPCGYRRRAGRGEAILLGTWPVADSVAGRIGDVLEIQDDPSAGDGPPAKTIVFDYTNQRRGGEVVSGGITARWDGENVHPVSNEINTTSGAVSLPPLPDRPIDPAHLEMARRLHGRSPICAASDHHIQARVLFARAGGAATVSVVNRYDIDVDFDLRLRLGDQPVRLPLRGAMRLPAHSALLLPVEYELARGVSVEQATVQLLDAAVKGRRLSLTVSSPAGGELLLGLPGALVACALDGAPAPASQRGSLVYLRVPAGEHGLELTWTRRSPVNRGLAKDRPVQQDPPGGGAKLA